MHEHEPPLLVSIFLCSAARSYRTPGAGRLDSRNHSPNIAEVMARKPAASLAGADHRRARTGSGLRVVFESRLRPRRFSVVNHA